MTIAYYLAREDKRGLTMLGYKNFRVAFIAIGEILHQKPSTVKNMRDEYDPYCDNNRKGWYQRKLSGSRKRVFDTYKNLSSEEFLVVVQNILAYYQPEAETSPKARKVIKIGSGAMREIKTKGKI